MNEPLPHWLDPGRGPSRAGRLGRAPVGFLVLILLARAGAAVAAAGSGDVDGDGLLTTRDVQMIQQIAAGDYDGYPNIAELRSAGDVNGDSRCDAADAEALVRRVVTNWADIDNDGVPNEQDCAPLDDRLATPYTFYDDLDKDSFGVLQKPEIVKTITPPAALAPWGDDPDDASQYALALSLPVGQRLLGLDFTDGAEDHRWRDDLVRELGANATTLDLLWNQIETSPNLFQGPQLQALQIANTQYADEGLTVSLSVNPIWGRRLALPADLQAGVEAGTVRINAPACVRRFNALLDSIHTRLDRVRPAVLLIGYNVDQYYQGRPEPQFWSDYQDFLRQVGAHARTLWGNRLRVGTIATRESLVNEPTRTVLQALNTAGDVVGATYFPHTADFRVTPPEQIGPEIDALVALYAPKPIIFQAVGYPSAPSTGSSAVHQSQFIRAIFQTWDRRADLIPLICFRRLHDLTSAQALEEAQAEPGLASARLRAATDYFQTLGLRTYPGTGAAKAAYKTLRNMAFERFWWRSSRLQSRSFRMGFTPTPYDNSQSSTETAQISNWMNTHLWTEGDLIALHFDAGVPWSEALTDDFSTSQPPYSSHVLNTWRLYRDSRPSNVKLVLSVNPIGIPRDQLASYWGVGEGFEFECGGSFRHIPNGVIGDTDNRVLPAPWNTYRFDDAPVKTAFLNYCRRALDFFHPDFFCIGIEVSALLNTDRAKFSQYVNLHKYVYTQLKADPRYRDTPIFVSFSATSYMTDEYGVALKTDEQPPGKLAWQLAGLQQLLPYTDIIGLSLYPHYGKYNCNRLPAAMIDDLFAMLARLGKPVGFTEAGYPADAFDVIGTLFTGDTLKQYSFLKLVLEGSERVHVPVRFITYFLVRDTDNGWARQDQYARDHPDTACPMFVQFYKYFRDIGLYSGDGDERPASQFWHETFILPYREKPAGPPAAVAGRGWEYFQ